MGPQSSTPEKELRFEDNQGDVVRVARTWCGLVPLRGPSLGERRREDDGGGIRPRDASAAAGPPTPQRVKPRDRDAVNCLKRSEKFCDRENRYRLALSHISALFSPAATSPLP